MLYRTLGLALSLAVGVVAQIADCDIVIYPANGDTVYYDPNDSQTLTLEYSSTGSGCSGSIELYVNPPSMQGFVCCSGTPLDGTGQVYSCPCSDPLHPNVHLMQGSAPEGTYDIYVNLGSSESDYDIYFTVTHEQATASATVTSTATLTTTTTTTSSEVTETTTTTVAAPATVVVPSTTETAVIAPGPTTTVQRTFTRTSTHTAYTHKSTEITVTETAPCTSKYRSHPRDVQQLAARDGSPPGPYPVDGDGPLTYTTTSTVATTVTSTTVYTTTAYYTSTTDVTEPASPLTTTVSLGVTYTTPQPTPAGTKTVVHYTTTGQTVTHTILTECVVVHKTTPVCSHTTKYV